MDVAAYGGRNSSASSLSNMDTTPITVNMSCPQVKVGELIGKRGIIVQEIMKRSGCKVYVGRQLKSAFDIYLDISLFNFTICTINHRSKLS